MNDESVTVFDVVMSIEIRGWRLVLSRRNRDAEDELMEAVEE